MRVRPGVWAEVEIDGGALGAVRVAGEFVVAAGHVAAVVEQLGAVGVGVLDGVGVEVLVHRIAAVVAAAEGLRFHRPGALHPASTRRSGGCSSR